MWNALVDSFVSTEDPEPAVLQALDQLRSGPGSVESAIPPSVAEEYKVRFADFVLDAIRLILDDHAVSDAEMADLRRLCRIFRIEEGDLQRLRPDVVRHILARELELLFADEQVDSGEAIHKVRLQELLGLSYDEFLDATRGEIDKVLLRLLERVDSSLGPNDLQTRIHWFRNVSTALDTVYDLNPPAVSSGVGHIYLLANGAMPGLVKVGKTTRPLEMRVTELSGATGVPARFELLFDVPVSDIHAAEKFVHGQLEAMGARYADNREFFSVPARAVVAIMLQARDLFPAGPEVSGRIGV